MTDYKIIIRLGRKIRIKAVVDTFRPLELDVIVAPEGFDVHDAHGVGLGKYVHVAKVPAKRLSTFCHLVRITFQVNLLT